MTAEYEVKDQGWGDDVSPPERRESVFRERRIAVRTGNGHRIIAISRTSQVGLVFVGMVVFGWLAYSGYALIRTDIAMESREQAITVQSDQAADARGDYDEVAEQLRAYQQRYAEISAELTDSQKRLSGLMGDKSQLEGDLSASTAELAAKESTVDGLIDETSSLRNELTGVRQRLGGLEQEKADLLAVEQQVQTANSKLARQETALEDLVDQNLSLKSDLVAAGDQLRNATTETEKLQAANAKAATRITRLTKSEQAVDELLDQNLLLKAELVRTGEKIRKIDEARIAERARSEKLGKEVAVLGAQIKQLKSRAVAMEKDATRPGKNSDLALAAKDAPPPSADEAQLLAMVAKLERRITALQRSQQDFLLHVTERTINTIDEAERTIALTGLGVEWLLARAEKIPVAMGGPFIDVNAELMAETELRQEVSVLDSHMSRWERLQYILRVLPLSAPVDAYRVTSKFGKRKDPLNGRWAMHFGMDMAAPSGSPILVPAAGTVVAAGWNAGFGRTIEIDHGMGIRTRYGHLRSIAVKKGKKVGFRDTIGLLGSSGRSTGPHVHYEILVDGKAVDPTKFLTAGKYVFKG